jgi:hypothetical protein
VRTLPQTKQIHSDHCPLMMVSERSPDTNFGNAKAQSYCGVLKEQVYMCTLPSTMTEAATVRRHSTVNSPPERNRSLRTGRIVVDWSDVFTRIGEDIDPLLEWVKTYPNTSDIHVFLGPVRRKPVRLLRNCLQSLGCKVTSRLPLPV